MHLLSAPAPTADVPLAHTGIPLPRNSVISRIRPSTTIPSAPRAFIRAATRPPRTALRWLGGCDMTQIEEAGVRSAKWVFGGIEEGSGKDFSAKRIVWAGAMIGANIGAVLPEDTF